MENTLNIIKQQINNYSVLLYMKGSPNNPKCGFSAQVAKILLNLKINFHFIDILNFPDIRSVLPKYANWPTFPQLWVNQELIGGCDIITEMFNNGELFKILKKFTKK